MKKEILLSIAGLHMIEEEDGNVEVVTAGDYYNRNGKHYVVYDEVVEGLSGHISNTIKIGDNSLEVMKRGLTNTRMIFEKGKKTLTRYQTPYGILDLSILARWKRRRMPLTWRWIMCWRSMRSIWLNAILK